MHANIRDFFNFRATLRAVCPPLSSFSSTAIHRQAHYHPLSPCSWWGVSSPISANGSTIYTKRLETQESFWIFLSFVLLTSRLFLTCFLYTVIYYFPFKKKTQKTDTTSSPLACRITEKKMSNTHFCRSNASCIALITKQNIL